MNKIDRIKKMKQELGAIDASDETLIERKVRLKLIVDEHGYELVAAASGLKVSSILTYLKAKHPRVSERALSDAEEILNDLA